MTRYRDRKVIAYRPEKDTLEYLEQLLKLNPDLSLNQRVDALVRYAMKSLKADETVITLKVEVEDNLSPTQEKRQEDE